MPFFSLIIFPFFPFTSSHLHLITSSHLQMLTSSSRHITHLHIFTALHTHKYLFVCALYLYIFSLRHLHLLKHLHIFLSQLHISLYFSSLLGHPSSSFLDFLYLLKLWLGNLQNIYLYILLRLAVKKKYKIRSLVSPETLGPILRQLDCFSLRSHHVKTCRPYQRRQKL